MKKFFSVCLMVAVFCGGAFAAEIPITDGDGHGLRVVSERAGGQGSISLKLNCSIDKLFFYDAPKTPKGDFTVLYSPDFHFGGAYGTPQIPVYTQLVQIPAGADVRVEVKSYEAKTYNLADHGISTPIFPRQPSAPKDGSEVPFVYEKSSYIFKGFHGQQLAELEDIGVMRHMRLAHLTVSPIRYNPVDNKLMVYNNLEVEIIMTGANLKNDKASHDTLWTPAFNWMEKFVLVPQTLRFGTRNAAQKYVIVADPMFKEELAPFITWKTQKGFKVEVAYTDQFGDTGSAISTGVQKYLHDMYNNATAANPAPSYVLFVGDHEQIPAFRGQTGSHITDLYYAAVTPGDCLPDFLTGRFSAQNVQELQPQIAKTLEYEKFQFADPSFLDDVVLIAGWDSNWARSHGWTHIKYGLANYFNAAHGFKNVNTFLSASSQHNTQEIVATVAKGASYVNYTAHGSNTSWADPRFLISDIQKLGNKGKYPFVIGNCCITSTFQLPQCFGEAWLRTADGGAIGYVGGSNSTYWDEDFWWGVGLHSIVRPNPESIPPDKDKTGPGAFDILFEGTGTSNAGFMVAGNLAVESSTSSRKKYYWEVYHLMGDPALKTFMGKPKALRVAYDQEMGARAGSIKVSAPAGSYIGISHGDNLLGAGYVDETGEVEISLGSVPESGQATVVVTAANGIPHIGTISIK